jgi:hypothetical protein
MNLHSRITSQTPLSQQGAQTVNVGRMGGVPVRQIPGTNLATTAGLGATVNSMNSIRQPARTASAHFREVNTRENPSPFAPTHTASSIYREQPAVVVPVPQPVPVAVVPVRTHAPVHTYVPASSGYRIRGRVTVNARPIFAWAVIVLAIVFTFGLALIAHDQMFRWARGR